MNKNQFSKLYRTLHYMHYKIFKKAWLHASILLSSRHIVFFTWYHLHFNTLFIQFVLNFNEFTLSNIIANLLSTTKNSIHKQSLIQCFQIVYLFYSRYKGMEFSFAEPTFLQPDLPKLNCKKNLRHSGSRSYTSSTPLH